MSHKMYYLILHHWCKPTSIGSSWAGAVGFIQTRKIHLVLEVWCILATVFGTTTAPIWSAIIVATAAPSALVRSVVISTAIKAVWCKPAAATSVWTTGTAPATTHRLISKVYLNRQKISASFDAVTFLLLVQLQQTTRLPILASTHATDHHLIKRPPVNVMDAAHIWHHNCRGQS